MGYVKIGRLLLPLSIEKSIFAAVIKNSLNMYVSSQKMAID